MALAIVTAHNQVNNMTANNQTHTDIDGSAPTPMASTGRMSNQRNDMRNHKISQKRAERNIIYFGRARIYAFSSRPNTQAPTNWLGGTGGSTDITYSCAHKSNGVTTRQEERNTITDVVWC